MLDTKAELTRSWLIKAKRDLLSAEQLASATPPLLDTAAYHCQQCAEKALKGFLVFHNVRFGKTHDIEVLLLQAKEIDPDFVACMTLGRNLTPFATEFRYPGEYLEPDDTEFHEALQIAESILLFVLKKLPSKTHPSK